MRGYNKTIAFVVAVCIAATATPIAFAAAPKAITDETAYVMLDYYGEVDNYSVVKGCDLNGNTALCDYGDYSKVQNMSTLDEPTYFEKGVSWSIENFPSNRFYYEVTPKNQSPQELPWTVDVSYKLNGTPIHADKLAGASGLVEIDVAATPNPKANEYFRDNFIFICAMTSNTADNTGFSAEGAQLQSIGSMQAALYMALPKQEESFHFEIGTDSFETTGVMMAMVPATLSQLDDIKEIKEHKQNLEDAGNASDQIIADMLDIAGAMRGGMTTAAKGFEKLEEARSGIDQNRDKITVSVGKLRSSLWDLEKRLNDYGEFLGDSDMSGSISDSLTDIGGSMTGAMEDVASDVKALNIALVTLSKTTSALAQAGTNNADELTAFAIALQDAETVINSVDIATTKRYIAAIKSYLAKIDAQYDVLDSADPADQVYSAALLAVKADLNSINTQLSTINSQSQELAGSLSGSLGSLSAVSGEIEDLLEETSRVVDHTADLLKDTRGMLNSVDDALKASSDALNDGARLSIAGATRMLDDMIAVLQKTDNLQSNRQIISDIIRDEWHRLDDDFGVLDIDTSAQKVSFTSAKNAEPRSLQIILRTQEIEVEEAEEELPEIADGFSGNIGDRIIAVFKSMGDSITNMFKK